MIFVTVGTHEQPFNRLIKYIDELKSRDIIREEVIIQTGYSTYEPLYCEWYQLLPYKKMEENIRNARIVITHGGPASFIMPLQIRKIPIVVPRYHEFGEHINNHQVDFIREVSERQKMIIPIYTITNLQESITNYDSIIKKMNNCFANNNKKFNEELEKIVNNIR